MTATEYLLTLGECLSTPIATERGVILPLDRAMDTWANHVAHIRAVQRVIHLIGNGGSAAVVAHAQNDLVKAAGVRAHCYQDVPLLTAFANDHGYEKGYTDALAIWLEYDDMLIAVSSSGASPNMLHAARRATEASAVLVTLTGFEPTNPLRQLGDLNFYVPSSDYGHVEITHQALLHCLTDRVGHAR